MPPPTERRSALGVGDGGEEGSRRSPASCATVRTSLELPEEPASLLFGPAIVCKVGVSEGPQAGMEGIHGDDFRTADRDAPLPNAVIAVKFVFLGFLSC